MLKIYGVGGQLLKGIQAFDREANACVRVGGEFSESFAVEVTGWPRRTIQDVLKALPGIGVELIFIQDGCRHNDGYYQLSDWGPFDIQWIQEHRTDIAASLGFECAF